MGCAELTLPTRHDGRFMAALLLADVEHDVCRVAALAAIDDLAVTDGVAPLAAIAPTPGENRLPAMTAKHDDLQWDVHAEGVF
jgi:hypothetical protein